MSSGPRVSTQADGDRLLSRRSLLFYALVPAVYYGMLDAKRQNPLHSILVFDLGGITHFTGENQFPVAWSAEQTALLTGKCYDPVRWDPIGTSRPARS